ncbi:MAG: DUF853 family protein [Lachnospiraceae bacterium]|nr:DUF853 family protein [Lachnospiraceae bacterium]
MLKDGKVWVGTADTGEQLVILPKMANRHGLVSGATGTGKTVTLKVMSESFSALGVPVFLADVKGDLAGIADAGTASDAIRERLSTCGADADAYAPKGSPVTLWDIYGEKGIQLRTTISEMGPLLLSRILQLNDLQSDILTIIFKIADENGWLLVDTKDLKSVVNYVSENNKQFEEAYGKMAPASLSVIMRAIVALESAGGETFFGETALNIGDWFAPAPDGRGMIHILESESLINNPRLYSTFLLWLLSELFEELPEVGDLEKPKMVFFFDEAHLLFNDAPKALLDKIEQVVKLIRSKGVGVYFCTQNPRDIPDGVLAQLGNKVQHALRAYTPVDQKAVKAAAESFRENPAFKTYDAILALGTGEAIVSFLGEDGIPMMANKATILPPESALGALDAGRRDGMIKGASLYGKYSNAYDPDSAFEFLQRKKIEDAEALEAAKREEEEAKQKAKEEAAAQKAAEKAERDAERAKQKEEQAAANAKKRAAKSVGSSVAGTVGREVGKSAGGLFGRFGKTLGGNLGASLGRGILGTFFK